MLINAIVRDGSHSKGLAPAALDGKVATDPGTSARGTSEEVDQSSRLSSVIEGDADMVCTPEGNVTSAALQMGRGWEKKILRLEDGRRGWEASLVGCLVKVSRIVITHRTRARYTDGRALNLLAVSARHASQHAKVDRHPFTAYRRRA